MATPLDVAALTSALAGAGCVAAADEAAELMEAARSDHELRGMLARRVTGEPLAWITGRVAFCGLDVAVEPGVYVPRWQSERLALTAAERLPANGLAVDLCTGAGAIAMVMRAAHPGARVVATEIDPLAVHCAEANGLEVHQGDLDRPLPSELASQVDVMTGVLPYVPRHAFHLLPRDVARYEPAVALDGGEGGLEVIARAVRNSPRWVRIGGWLLLEIGGDQVTDVTAMYVASGYRDVDVLVDEDGDPRAVCGDSIGCLGAYCRLSGMASPRLGRP